MPGMQWARIRPAEASHLRRGAWYRVVKLTPQEAVLDVNGTLTAFPRPSLEILPTRPTRWTVVPRPPRSARLPITWGSRYGVCPNCRARARHALSQVQRVFRHRLGIPDVLALALITILCPRPFSSPFTKEP